MLISSVITLVIALAIIGICYLLVKWIVGLTEIPAPLIQIANIIFAVIGIVTILRFLLTVTHVQ